MKKVLGIIGVTIVVIGILISSFGFNNSKSKDRVFGKSEISYNKVTEKMQNNNFILYVGRDDCRDCQEFNIFLDQYLKDNPEKGLYYLDVEEIRKDSLSSDTSEEKKSLYEEVKIKLDIEWVPTVLLINGEKIVSKYEFLDKSYYDIKSDSEKANFLERERKEFIDWMNDSY